MKAVLLVSHGSRSPKTVEEVQVTLNEIRRTNTADYYDFAFLELQEPDIPTGIQRCIDRGATEVIVLMNFLNAGRHVDEDIPEIIYAQQANYPSIKIHMTKPVGQHPRMIDLFKDLIQYSS